MKKIFKDSVSITIKVERDYADWLRHMAIKMSNQEGRQIGLSETVRMAVEEAYPMPKDRQIHMFKQ